MIRILFLAAVTVLLAALQPSFAQTASTTSALELARKNTNAEVILLRGFGNVFSRGLDEMGEKLKKEGVDARVAHHSEWRDLTNEIIANRVKHGRRPIVLIGHSLGANAILRMATELKKRRIVVDYMVTFAATDPEPVPANVRKLTNYYFKTDGWGEEIERGPGFRGNLKNIDFSTSKTVGHFNIEKQPRLQRQVINNVLRFVSGMRSDADMTEVLTGDPDLG